MPATIPLYHTRENSTIGAGSLFETVNTGLVNGTVSLTIPDPGGTVQYSNPTPTTGGTITLSGQTNIQNVAPDGKGWFLEDSTTMTGKRTDNSAATTMGLAFENFSGLVDANLYLRFFKYNTTSQTFTYIGVIYDLTSTLRNSVTAAFNATLPRSVAFTSADRLYVDLLWYFPDGTSTSRTVTMRTGDGNSLQLRTITNAELAPANDNFANATALAQVAADAKSASNVYCSYEEGEPLWEQYSGGGGFLPNNIDGPGSLWWKWTAPTGQGITTVYFDTTGSFSNVFSNLRLNTRLRVWTADIATPTFDDLTLVAQNDNMGSYSDNGAFEDDPPMSTDKYSKVRINDIEEGRTYWIQIMTCSYNGDLDPPSTTGTVWCRSQPAYRGAWTEQSNIATLDGTVVTAGTLGSEYNLRRWLNEVGDNYYSPAYDTQKTYHGDWSIWQGGGMADPVQQPEAYNCASQHAHNGDQSNDFYGNNNDQTGWNNDCAPLRYARPDPEDLTDSYGGGGSGSGLRSGGRVSALPQDVFGGGMLEIQSVFSFEIVNPYAPAFMFQNWTYLNNGPEYTFPLTSGSTGWTQDLPAGVLGVVYEKENCDIVRCQVRPSANGTSEHPSYDSSAITAEWHMQETAVGSAPAVGWGYWETEDTVAAGAGSGAMHTKYFRSGNAALTRGGTDIGDVSFSGGALTSRTESWTLLLQYLTIDESMRDGGWDQTMQYVFTFVATYILDKLSIGYQGGTPSWSFTRRINNHGLEIDLELRRPRYALLYATPQNPVDPPPPEWPLPDIPQIDGGLLDTRNHFWRKSS